MYRLTTNRRVPYLRAVEAGTFGNMADPPPRGSFRRACDAINLNPIPTLILVVAIITFVLWNKVDASIQALNLATGSLHTATTRLDGLVKDMGSATTEIKHINAQTAIIPQMSDSLHNIERELASLNSKFNSIRPYELRVIESYGVKADENLIVDVMRGSVIAYPLNAEKQAELQKAQFRRTSVSITHPIYTLGWALPITASVFMPGPTLPNTFVPKERSPQ
jgi:hypothetical protein